MTKKQYIEKLRAELDKKCYDGIDCTDCKYVNRKGSCFDKFLQDKLYEQYKEIQGLKKK